MSNEIETRDEQLWAYVALELGKWNAAPEMSDIAPHVEAVIAAVRAAAWQEFEAAMLDEQTLEAMVPVLEAESLRGRAASIPTAEYAMQAALGHIAPEGSHE